MAFWVAPKTFTTYGRMLIMGSIPLQTPPVVSVAGMGGKPTSIQNGYTAIPLTVKIEYFNSTGTTVTIVGRNGLAFELPSGLARGQDPHVGVKVTYTAHENVKFDVHGILNADPKKLSPDLAAIHAELLKPQGRPTSRMTGASVYYAIPLSKINTLGGSLYVAELDIVVSTRASDGVPYHPLCPNGLEVRLIERDIHVNDETAFGYGLRISDPNERFGPRFINYNGRVWRVPAITNSLEPEGIWETCNCPAEGGYSVEGRPQLSMWTFEDANEGKTPIMLYRTYDEALAQGDLNTKRSRDLDERERKLNKTQETLDQKKLQQERELEDRKAAQDRAHADAQDELRRKQQQLQDDRTRYEDEKRRSAQYQKVDDQSERLKQREDELFERFRKESADMEARRNEERIRREEQRNRFNDVLKWVPLIISAVIAVAKIYEVKSTKGTKNG